MDIEIITDSKDVFEIEFSDKTLPNLILAELVEAGVDAYSFAPHPLLPQQRLHVEGSNPKKAFLNAQAAAEDKWKNFAVACTKALAKK